MSLSATITLAFALLQANIIVEDQPVNEIAKTIGNLSIEYLTDINNTKIDIETLQAFKDEVVPCINEVYEKYGNDTQGYDVMWVQCFNYVETTQTTEAPVVCDSFNAESMGNFVMFTFAIILLFVMTCCVQRRHRACLSCCFGFPGPVVPLNMLDNYVNRKGYMLAFGVTISSIVSVFLGNNESLIGNLQSIIVEASKGRSYISIFVKIFLSIYVAVINYPFFIAQNLQNRLLGAILGLFFSFAWIALTIFKMYAFVAICLEQYEEGTAKTLAAFAIFYDIPGYICIILLTIKYIYMIFETHKQRAEKSRKGQRVNWLYENDTDWRKEFAYIHVKEVFEKHLKVDEEDSEVEMTFIRKTIASLKKKLYKVVPGFQYSTRMLVSTFSAVLSVYIIVVVFVLLGHSTLSKILDPASTNKLTLTISDMTGISLRTIKDYFNAFRASYWVALATSIISYALVVMNSLTWYRKHILKLRIGDRSFLPNSIKNNNFDTSSLMVASFKFAGFQVAYAAWGFILSSFVFWVIWFVISTQIFLPMVRKELSTLLILLVRLWPNILIAIIMIIIQRVIAVCCFLHDEDTLAVDNRRAYHITSYFLFYFNIFLGLVSCLIRIVFGLLFGVAFLQRLQKSTLPRSYERRDPGYLAYLGFLLLEHQHSNPVLQCFVRLLLESKGMELKDEFFRNPTAQKVAVVSLVQGNLELGDQEKARQEVFRKSRIRNRWHLYKTLSLNPSIIKYRIRFMKKKKEKEFLTSKLTACSLTTEGCEVDKPTNKVDDLVAVHVILEDDEKSKVDNGQDEGKDEDSETNGDTDSKQNTDKDEEVGYDVLNNTYL